MLSGNLCLLTGLILERKVVKYRACMTDSRPRPNLRLLVLKGPMLMDRPMAFLRLRDELKSTPSSIMDISIATNRGTCRVLIDERYARC